VLLPSAVRRASGSHMIASKTCLIAYSGVLKARDLGRVLGEQDDIDDALDRGGETYLLTIVSWMPWLSAC
jgi:hypothetical protein